MYHLAKLSKAVEPVVILNIGGVSNVTYINGKDILAFDTGPGNALIDDWVAKHTDQSFDENGNIASEGSANHELLSQWLDDLYFKAKPPKSLDRNSFDYCTVEDLSLEDGAATLIAFTALSIAKAREHFSQEPKSWYVTGGGRHNKALMSLLEKTCEADIKPVEDLGWNGDAIEAEGFAYLAVRSVLKLPLTLPTTKGCPEPLTGGKIAQGQ